MKPSTKLIKIGKWLMQRGKLAIHIADDEDAYFNEKMINTARRAGYHGITRVSYVTREILDAWLETPPDILILDVKNVCDPSIAKDGIELARLMVNETNSFVALTSAHQWHFRRDLPKVDYFIENRNLTSADFVDELSTIIDKYLSSKAKFYKHVMLRVGTALSKGAMQGSP